MIFVIDESGDPGFKFSTGSSEYFVCLAVALGNAADAEACDHAITDLRRELRLAPGYEFHFAECSNRVRCSFFRTVAQQNFNFYASVLDKRKISGERLQTRSGFYEYSVELLCEIIHPVLHNSTIIIDKCGDRPFQLSLEKALKTKLTLSDGSCPIKKISMKKSYGNNLVQLADMVCGAVSRSYGSTRSDRKEFRDILRKREGRVELWPK